MINVVFIQPDGRRDEVQAPIGDSLMDAAVDNGIEGIIGQCGGGCTCCTCHCWVEQAWLDKVSSPRGNELDLLAYANGLEENSRLACQIRLNEDLDGLTVSIPFAS
jgi:2Fe-2S ferredoxin